MSAGATIRGITTSAVAADDPCRRPAGRRPAHRRRSPAPATSPSTSVDAACRRAAPAAPRSERRARCAGTASRPLAPLPEQQRLVDGVGPVASKARAGAPASARIASATAAHGRRPSGTGGSRIRRVARDVGGVLALGGILIAGHPALVPGPGHTRRTCHREMAVPARLPSDHASRLHRAAGARGRGRLLARTAEGALMRRAAFGLAVHARRMLGGPVPVAGAAVALLVGAGNNGGDALWAGVELRRRGVGVTAVLLAPDGPTRPGSPPCAGPAAGSSTRAPAARAAVARADLVLDGIVGISGRGRAARAGGRAGRRGAPGRRAGAGRRPAQRRRPGHRRGRRARGHRDRDRHLRRAQAGARAGRGPLRPGAPGRHRARRRCCPSRTLYVLDAGRRRGALAGARPGRRQVHPGRRPASPPARRPTPGAAVLATGAAVLATSGMVRFAGGAAARVRARWPEVVATDIGGGRRPHPGVGRSGPGIGTDDAGPRRAGRRARPRRADLRRRRRRSPCSASTTDLRASAAPAGRWCSPRTTASSPASPARWAPTGSAAARRAAAELGVTVLLKGNATVVADPDGRALVHPSTHVVGGHRRLRRRAVRDHRRAARGRAGAVVGGRLRDVRARPGRRSWPPTARRPRRRGSCAAIPDGRSGGVRAGPARVDPDPVPAGCDDARRG